MSYCLFLSLGKEMTLFLAKLFFLQNLVAEPAIPTRQLALVEAPAPAEGEHLFLLPLDDSMRSRHFLVRFDKSACRGPLKVNGEVLLGEDAANRFRFDRSNEIHLAGCLERTLHPVTVVALPRVYVAQARAKRTQSGEVEISVSIRNTLPNSATCILTASGHEEQFFVGPETSQTRSFSVRLDNRSMRIELEMLKLGEAIEGAYRHQVTLSVDPLRERSLVIR